MRRVLESSSLKIEVRDYLINRLTLRAGGEDLNRFTFTVFFILIFYKVLVISAWLVK
jgi:hypothetical protein